MTSTSEHIKERVYVGAIMASYATGSFAAALTLLAGLVVIGVLLLRVADLCSLGLIILIGAAAILVSCFVLGFVGGILGAFTGGLGASLQLVVRRALIGVPVGAILGAGLGWLLWLSLHALVLWLCDGEEAWRETPREFATAALTNWFGSLGWALVGLVGGGTGAFHVVLFQQVFDKKSRAAKPGSPQ